MDFCNQKIGTHTPRLHMHTTYVPAANFAVLGMQMNRQAGRQAGTLSVVHVMCMRALVLLFT